MNPAPKSATAFGAWRGSLRTQLVAWNILALALLLAALGLIIRYTVQTTIMASVDRELNDRVRQFFEHGPPPPGPPPGDRGRGAPFNSSPPPPRSSNPYRPRLFDLAGRGVGPFGSQNAPWDSRAITQAGAERTAVFSSKTVDGVPLRILSVSFPPDGAPEGVIQVAYPLTDVDRAMGGLDRALLILIPVALLCAGIGGAALTDRVLRRVRQMSQAAARIGARSFSARLPVSGQDEFSELADTFNGMLGRLEGEYQKQQALVEQQRRFTADASHELKTPLTIIKGNTSMALNSQSAESDYRHSMVEIDHAADTMDRLVRDLLLLARSDSGQLGRDQVELLAREVLDRAISRVARPQAASIAVAVEDSALTITGNEDELIRLFANLLDNSIRHTPPNGKITVNAAQTEQCILVTVADNGSGIAAEHLPHLGERFYRVDSARARLDGGTGLGLSICRSIAEAHGGSIHFASAVNIGTTVTVSLPAGPSASSRR